VCILGLSGSSATVEEVIDARKSFYLAGVSEDGWP
jgi:hypothetical protein